MGAMAIVEDYFTLLAVRADGVASVVDLIPDDGEDPLERRALAMLREHGSCETVEVWRGGALVQTFSRPGLA